MANQYSADVPKGFNVPKQVRLDSITGIQNEAALKNLGTGNNLAFKYYDGLKIYCKDEKKEYIWRQVVGSETGLLTTHFVYPTYPAIDGINYSGKSFNFFEVNNTTIVVDGSETKINAGTNITKSGTGTTLDPYVISANFTPSQTIIEEGTNVSIDGEGTSSEPYVINVDLSNLGIVKTVNNQVTAPDQTLSLINSETSGKVLTTKEYVQSIVPATPNGSETIINPGTNITIAGNGTVATPYVINTNITNSNIYTGTSPTTLKVGGLEIGTNISGQSYDAIIQSMLAPYILPTISLFTMSGQSQTVESGTVIEGVETFINTFTQIQNILNNSLKIFYNTTEIANNLSISTLTSTTSTIDVPLINLIGNNTNYSFKSKIIATDSNETEIESPLFTIVSRYKQFFGNVTNFPTNSTEVRALVNNNFANINSWTTPVVNTTKFSVSIPATKSLISVITANFENITSSFVLNTFNVNDLGGTPISYKTYNYQSSLPLNLTLTITTS
jgi:hypothetical protein